jgi:peptidoglycan hydrolase-like protein with peptidoglycan-binding domain
MKLVAGLSAVALAVLLASPALAASDTSVGEKVKEGAQKTKEKIADTFHKVKDKVSNKTSKDKTDEGDVKAAQQALKERGFDPGPIDGTMGPKTRAALADFQKKEGLKPTGTLDKKTMARLSTGSPQSPSASPSTERTPERTPGQ